MRPEESTTLTVMAFTLLQNARPHKAVVLLEALDLLEPGQPATLRRLAAAQIRSSKPDKALRTLDRLAIAGGVDALFHLMRAQALVALNRPIEASQAMSTFVRLRGSTGPGATTH